MPQMGSSLIIIALVKSINRLTYDLRNGFEIVAVTIESLQNELNLIDSPVRRHCCYLIKLKKFILKFS